MLAETETFFTLLRNQSHWEFEGFLEILTAIISYPIGKLWLKRHDKNHHQENVMKVRKTTLFDETKRDSANWFAPIWIEVTND